RLLEVKRLAEDLAALDQEAKALLALPELPARARLGRIDLAPQEELVHPVVFVLVVLAAELRPQARLQDGELARLGDEVIGARRERVEDRLLVVPPGQHEDRNRPPCDAGLDALARELTREARQHHVKQDAVDATARERGKRFLSRSREHGDIPLVLQCDSDL